VKFEQVFSFKYSPRPHTEAAGYTNAVDPAVASERLTRLQARHDEILDELSEKHLGRVYRVYFEELKPDGMVAGRSDNNILVKAEGSEELLGTFADVKITKVSRLVQTGEIVG
jgi:tRNA-2-methylthio-N6-dimethylallyladenosine synthase